MPPSAYPNTATIGQFYTTYKKEPPDWKDVTLEVIFEDQGADRNLSAASAVQRWAFVYRGLSETQAKVLDDHYDSANGPFQGFSFTEPRNYPWSGTTGTVFTDVHYEVFERDHDRILHNQIRRVVLIKRPV